MTGDDRHRPVDGRRTHHRAAGPAPLATTASAVLGYSPLRTQPPTAPGHPAASPALGAAGHRAVRRGHHQRAGAGRAGATPECARPMRRRWPGASTTTTSTPRWCGGISRTTRPGTAMCRRGDRPPFPLTVVLWCLAPGATLAEAAAIRCPVLVALGERDVLVDPRGEPRATSRRAAWTSSSARGWRTCTTSPGRGNCSGAASRRGPSGYGRCGTQALPALQCAEGSANRRSGIDTRRRSPHGRRHLRREG